MNMNVYCDSRHATLTLCLCLLAVIGSSQDSEWTLKKEVDGIQVFTRAVEDSRIKEVRVVLTVEARLQAVVALLCDPAGYQNWVYKCSHSELLHQADPHTAYYYSRTDFPWPLQDREVIAKSVIHQDSATRVIRIHSSASPDFGSREEEGLRITELVSQWTITPQADGKLLLENQLLADPGGILPSWLINKAVDKGPTETMKQLKRELQHEKYQRAELSYIQP